jgi:FHA domain
MPACPSGHESSATDFCDICGMRIDSQPPGSAQSGRAQSGPAQSGPVLSGPALSGSASPGSASAHTGGGAIGSAGGAAEPCPQCGADRAGLFCEVCGFDFTTGTPSRPVTNAGLSAATPGATPAASASGATPAAATPGAGSAASAAAAAAFPSGGTPGSAPGAGAAESSGAGPGWTAVVTADRAYFERVVAAGGPDAAAMEFPGYCPERRFRLSGAEVRVGRRSVSRGLEPEIDLTGPPADPGVSHLHAVLIAQPDGTWSVLDPGSSNGTQVNGEDIAAGEAIPLRDGDRVYVGAWTTLTIQAS